MARGPDQVAKEELLAAGRLLLGQVSSMRAELQRLSAALLQQSATIAEALEELEDARPAPAGSGHEAPADSQTVPAAPSLEPIGRGDAGSGLELADESARARSPEQAAITEDARLVALDMALGGGTRAEIDRELEARFDLPDRAGLVDEVLRAIG